jgi:GTPase SAR1 family protein
MLLSFFGVLIFFIFSFFERIEAIFAKDYLPSDQDILRARLKTASILESVFSIGKFDFKFIDVGGQRNERRKWIHCFDGVTAILFIAAISAYDQTLYEDANVNRMHESLDVWADIVNNPNFKRTPIILFLNKHDLFLEKIPKVKLNVCFPEYEGKAGDSHAAEEYIRQKFVDRRGGDVDGEFFCHYTNATDTKNIEVVWKDCRNIILMRSLQGSGMAAELDG